MSLKNIFLLLLFIVLIAFSAQEQIVVGDRVCFKSGLNMRNGPCGAVVKTSTGGESGIVTQVVKSTSGDCSLGAYTWVHVQLDSNIDPTLLKRYAAQFDHYTFADLKTKLIQSSYGVNAGVWAAVETNLVYECRGKGNRTKNLPVPYVHQKFDTPDSFCGSWACGPTSSIMAVAYFGKIHPHAIQVSSPEPHVSLFGWYVSEVYTSNVTGSTFNRMQTDSCGKPSYGAYGTCTENGAAWAWRIQDFVKRNGLESKFYDAATFDILQNAIDQNHLVVLSTQLTTSGHLVLVRGYDTVNGKMDLIVNDPWGNKNEPGYGEHRNGENIKYSFSFIKAKWMVEVWQP